MVKTSHPSNRKGNDSFAQYQTTSTTSVTINKAYIYSEISSYVKIDQIFIININMYIRKSISWIYNEIYLHMISV
jgi:hypothetical protein